MPGVDPAVLVVREWVLKAENDLTNAVHTLELAEECPNDTVVETWFRSSSCATRIVGLTYAAWSDVRSMSPPSPA
jgi:hypothetical protein